MQVAEACPTHRNELVIDFCQTPLGVWIQKMRLGLEIRHDTQLKKLREPE